MSEKNITIDGINEALAVANRTTKGRQTHKLINLTNEDKTHILWLTDRYISWVRMEKRDRKNVTKTIRTDKIWGNCKKLQIRMLTNLSKISKAIAGSDLTQEDQYVRNFQELLLSVRQSLDAVEVMKWLDTAPTNDSGERIRAYP